MIRKKNSMKLKLTGQLDHGHLMHIEKLSA